MTTTGHRMDLSASSHGQRYTPDPSQTGTVANGAVEAEGISDVAAAAGAQQRHYNRVMHHSICIITVIPFHPSSQNQGEL